MQILKKSTTITKEMIYYILAQFDGGSGLSKDSQRGESVGHLSSPHRVWTRKCEGGERHRSMSSLSGIG